MKAPKPVDINKHQEVELKLRIAADDIAAFRKHPLLRAKAVTGPSRRKVFNIYFDTPDLLLKQNRMALRMRKVGGKWLQTLKTAGAATGALHRRGEWEFPLQSPQLDLSLFRETLLAALPESETLHLNLRQAFTTEFFRTTWIVIPGPGQRIEVALDQGVVRCGQRESVISEVEIELLEGDAAAIYDLALALSDSLPMWPAVISKAEQGYHVFSPTPLTPQRAAAAELKRSWTPFASYQAIVGACLNHFEANVDGAMTTDDGEFIHQLRVAIRRLRSALKIVQPARAAQFAADLKWLTHVLGTAREWEVLLDQTLPPLLSANGDAQLAQAVLQAGAGKHAEALAAARAALVSSRRTQLMLNIGREIIGGGTFELPTMAGDDRSTMTDSAALTLPAFSAATIGRCHRRLLKNSSVFDQMSAEAQHRVRIDAKRLRYAVEFFASLFGRRRVTRYLKTLTAIQALLGDAQDDAIATSLLTQLTPSVEFADFARGWFAARSVARLHPCNHAFDELRRAKRFWGKRR